jgi:hypothetical protein
MGNLQFLNRPAKPPASQHYSIASGDKPRINNCRYKPLPIYPTSVTLILVANYSFLQNMITMKEFMFFIRKQTDSKLSSPPETHRDFLKSCETYIGRLKREGKLISAQPIERAGKIISGKEGNWKEAGFNETTEAIGGYYHILANDLDEAIAIAKANPEFEFNQDTRIEVRPVKMKEETTGFTYPTQTNK